MKRDRNHEGYHDPTAGAAVRQVSRKKEKLPKMQRLMYQLQEAPGFWTAVEALK